MLYQAKILKAMNKKAKYKIIKNKSAKEFQSNEQKKQRTN